jgi:hypothetical protein
MDSYQVFTTVLSSFSLIVSFLSLIVSFWSYRKNIALQRHIQLLNERKAVAEHYSFYTHLIHSEFLSLREYLSNLSSLYSEAYYNIYHTLDMYDTRPVSYAYVDGKFVKPLRHLYDELRDGICAAFSYELPWQTVENITSRLVGMCHIEMDYELLENNKRRWWAFFIEPRRKKTPDEFFESDHWRSLVVELAHSIDITKSDKLISSIRGFLNPIHEFYENHAQKLTDSLQALESVWSRNKLEEFKLHEHQALYRQYMLHINTLKFLIYCQSLGQRELDPLALVMGLTTSPLRNQSTSRPEERGDGGSTFSSGEDNKVIEVNPIAKYYLTGSIILLGSKMAMANWLINRAFTIDE